MWSTVKKVLTRKKVVDPVVQESALARVLNAYDLTALGVGSTLGVGVYVLAGHVAKNVAGPAVVLSFFIAALASVFAGLCYAEFGARAPKAGSAYIYSYICVGEFVAFVIGWNLILEYIIGSASVARGLSLYLDTIINNTLQHTFREIAPIDIPYLSTYFDFVAFGISFLLAVALAFGVKESSVVNNVFTLLNLGVVVFVIIAGLVKAHWEYWSIDPHDIPANTTHTGSGYFFPFGVDGVIKGAATCFYGFVGFDCIATTGEEVRNPQKAIPISIILSLLIIFLSYFGTSAVVTLMVPYYAQDINAPIPHAFEVNNFEAAKWIVAIGGIFGLFASLFGAMFPLPRILYAMASDGIIFRFLGKVSTRFQTPIVGTMIAGLLTGLMGALFELKELVDMMSIGTLMAYTIVAASVLLLRYSSDGPSNLRVNTSSESSSGSHTYTENQPGVERVPVNEETMLVSTEQTTFRTVMRQVLNLSNDDSPTKISERLVAYEVFIYCVICVLIGLGAMYWRAGTTLTERIPFIVLTAISITVAVILLISIGRQPVSRMRLSFKVPFVPVIPAMSILINIYLMLMLDNATWIRFGVWMIVGLPTYFFSVRASWSSARNSSMRCKSDTTNGHVNKGFVNDLNDPGHVRVTEASSPLNDVVKVGSTLYSVSSDAMEADKVLTQLDAILDSEDNYYNKLTSDNASCLSDVVNEKSVVADVHSWDSLSISPPNSPNKSSNSSEPLKDSSSHSDDDNNNNNKFFNDLVMNNHGADFVVISPDTISVNIPSPPPLPSDDGNYKGVPKPPPFPDVNTVVKSKPQIIVFNDLRTMKLKPSDLDKPETPSIDYDTTPKVHVLDSHVDLPSDNLKKGTEEYNAFLEKLNQQLKKPAPTPYRTSLASITSKPIVVEHEPNEFVVAEHIDKDKARKKITEMLEHMLTGPLPERHDHRERFERNYESEETKNGSESMGGNNKIESEENKPVRAVYVGPMASDYVAKKNNLMDDLFKTIRLRKVDSFKEAAFTKENSLVNKDEEADAQNIGDRSSKLN